MSMWEIENITEEAVLLIDRANVAPEIAQNYLFSLFKIQKLFDTGFIHLRLLKALIKTGYTLSLPSIEDYPEYEKHKQKLAEIMAQEIGFITTDILNPDCYEIAAFWDGASKSLYYDFGSSVWQKLPQNAVPEFLPLTLLCDLIDLASHRNESALVCELTGFFQIVLTQLQEKDLTARDVNYFKQNVHAVSASYHQHSSLLADPTALLFKVELRSAYSELGKILERALRPKNILIEKVLTILQIRR